MEKQTLLSPSIGKGIAPPPPSSKLVPWRSDPHGGQEAWFKEISVGPETELNGLRSYTSCGPRSMALRSKMNTLKCTHKVGNMAIDIYFHFAFTV